MIAQLQQLVPSDLSKLVEGKAQYTVLLNEQGGIIDDLIVYHQGQKNGQQQITLIVNAGTTDKDKAWLQKHLSETVNFSDISRAQALIAVQGPQATATLQQLCPR